MSYLIMKKHQFHKTIVLYKVYFIVITRPDTDSWTLLIISLLTEAKVKNRTAGSIICILFMSWCMQLAFERDDEGIFIKRTVFRTSFMLYSLHTEQEIMKIQKIYPTDHPTGKSYTSHDSMDGCYPKDNSPNLH